MKNVNDDKKMKVLKIYALLRDLEGSFINHQIEDDEKQEAIIFNQIDGDKAFVFVEKEGMYKHLNSVCSEIIVELNYALVELIKGDKGDNCCIAIDIATIIDQLEAERKNEDDKFNFSLVFLPFIDRLKSGNETNTAVVVRTRMCWWRVII
jgi:hypothetical protein